MAFPAKKIQYTFADVLSWDESEHIEIINGEAFAMAAPSRMHQKISMELSRQLANYLEGKKCEVYPAPFSVRLFEQDGDAPEDVDTLVEPDISVICDRNKLDQYGCKGAPDMVIEVLSPSSHRHDQLVKLNLYQQAGVREYWIVDPENRIVRVMLLSDAGFLQPHEIYQQGDIARVTVLEGCFIELGKVFSE
ncbi:MAG: Uma2 family endonuclease [Lachnospiraceae bacterium]|nr:Uma2 family endonuclease [Lachnospiraceae bacterium]